MPDAIDLTTTKLAQRLADTLSAEIISGRLHDGHLLGSEAELTARLQVSRWTVREALTILERQGQVTIRRGRYGGIFVAEASPRAISNSIAFYLEFLRVDVRAIIEARSLLDEAIIERAVERIATGDIAQLRAERDLESEVAGVSAGFAQYDSLLSVARSPILQTFVRAVGQLGQNAILRSTLRDTDFRSVMRDVRLKRRDQIEAVIAGKIGDAMSLEGHILIDFAKLIESSRSDGGSAAAARERALRLLTGAKRFKRPELLMQEIASDIVARGWPVGEHLGSEPELMARYQVSRTAFREAIRSLEQLGVVQMRVGRHSGLKISSPKPEPIIRSSRQSFARAGISRKHLMDAFLAIGAGASGMAAMRPASSIDLNARLKLSEESFFEGVGLASENPIIALLMQILSSYAGKPLAGAVRSNLLLELVKAIDDRDPAAARRVFLSLPHATLRLPNLE